MADDLLNRRTFLIRLGAGVAGGIGGFFLMCRPPDLSMAAPPGNRPVSLRPQLRQDIVFGRHTDMATISYGRGERKVLCAVNRTGRIVISKLDGAHTIDRIGAALKSDLGLEAGAPLDAPIACFVAQLGLLGFLAEPFYATIYYENTQTYGS